jgi:hypothetical protein
MSNGIVVFIYFFQVINIGLLESIEVILAAYKRLHGIAVVIV